MAEQTNRQKIDNTALVEAINEMRESFSPETQNKVINVALRCTFLVPAVIDKKQELVADEDNHVKFQDKQTAKFVLINHPQRGSFFPVFTDAEEIKKLKTDMPYKNFAMKFSDIAGLTENTPNVNGFIINPFTQKHNLPFTKEMLASIKQTLIRVKKEREEAAKAQSADNAEEAKAPDITVSSSENNN